jgi:hypothetical protein
MKVAFVFATDGSDREDAVLAPFRSAGFISGLRAGGIEPAMIAVVPDDAVVASAPAAGEVRCRRHELAALLAAEQPLAVQTLGREQRLSMIWPIAKHAGAPIVHCVSCWRDGAAAPPRSLPPSIWLPSIAAMRAKRASRLVAAVIGTGRAAVGDLIAGGYFARATSSVMVAPPVERAADAADAISARAAVPVFGIYDPYATDDMIAFVSRAIELMGPRTTPELRIAMREPQLPVPAPISIVPAGDIAGFVAAIDVLTVPAYDDAAAAVLIAALRAGKPVIVPDPSGAAELIEYGRHGVMFCAGSAYHFAAAMDLVSQSWRETSVLRADGGPAIVRTDPVVVAESFAETCRRLIAATDGRRAMPQRPALG